jgi:hypothetical protein
MVGDREGIAFSAWHGAHGHSQQQRRRLGGWLDDCFSMVLHVVREHHYGFALVLDIHKASPIERAVQKLYNGPLWDHDRGIPGIPLRNRHRNTG